MKEWFHVYLVMLGSAGGVLAILGIIYWFAEMCQNRSPWWAVPGMLFVFAVLTTIIRVLGV